MPEFLTRIEYEARHAELRLEYLKDVQDLEKSIKALYDVASLQASRLTILETYAGIVKWLCGSSIAIGVTAFGYSFMH